MHDFTSGIRRTAMHGDFAFDFGDSGTPAGHNLTILSSWSEEMNPTVCKSNDPCIICGKVNKNVEVNCKTPRILATFCQEHLYDRLPERKEPKAKGID
jgi:hypothetical protein